MLLIRVVFFLGFTFMVSSLKAQLDSANRVLLRSVEFKEPRFESHRVVTFVKFNSKNKIIRYNPVSLSFGSLLFIYQKYVSAQIAASCPFELSCSEFSKAAIRRYGLIKGITLTADRLSRCSMLGIQDLNPKSDRNSDNNKIIDDIEWYR